MHESYWIGTDARAADFRMTLPGGSSPSLSRASGCSGWRWRTQAACVGLLGRGADPDRRMRDQCRGPLYAGNRDCTGSGFVLASWLALASSLSCSVSLRSDWRRRERSRGKMLCVDRPSCDHLDAPVERGRRDPVLPARGDIERLHRVRVSRWFWRRTVRVRATSKLRPPP